MKKLTKQAAALACAMLMTAGGFSQVSAAPVDIDDFHGATLKGTASKTSTTTVSATTKYGIGSSGASYFKITSRAYGKVNGAKQYGTEKYATGNGSTGTAVSDVYIMSGLGGTDYGGDHSLLITVKSPNGLSDTYKTGIRTSSY